MNIRRISLAIALATAAGAAHAAGPLALWEGGTAPQPYAWDTSNGPIPVYTDGGEAFTYDYDGSVFISIERANEITQFAFDEWSNVSTSTFAAEVKGSIESQIGLVDVDASTAEQVYGPQNGYGFWVIYDSDGAILEEWFGVPKMAVLGIAFPEWADEETGEIIEGTALMNGWNVHVSDTEGNKVAGVFTHEFGHAINLSHSQVNGPLVYDSHPVYGPKYPGVPGCVDPIHNWDTPMWYPQANRADPAIIETMYPFIDNWHDVAIEQSTVDQADDIAAISNLYPTADYQASTGSISGVLTLKDGKTEYSGINIVARNVANPLFDAVSAMTGDQTQGLLGPDGRFTINGLTPGAEYELYMEEIVAGGYPTAPRMLVSEAEYWNVAESSDPLVDSACDVTPITVKAGVTETADLVFNGFMKGIQYTPIVDAFLSDLAKNGDSAAGQTGNIAFIWDKNHGFNVLPPQYVTSIHSSMSRNGQKMLIQYDDNENGIQQAAIWSQNKVISLGDIDNGDSCGSGSQSGEASTFGWDIDDDGRTAVGTYFYDADGDGNCSSAFKAEIRPFIWDEKSGIRPLSLEGITLDMWIRAETVSGDGNVVIGSKGTSSPLMWIDEADPVDLKAEYGARYAKAVNYDGSIVALHTEGYAPGAYWPIFQGVVLLNPFTGETENIGGLQYCVDMPYYDWWGNDYCETYPAELIQKAFGAPPLTMLDMNDSGTVMIGRAGDFFTGFTGAIWIDGIGMMTMDDFLQKQGVVEARGRAMNFAQSISASGREIVGTLNSRGVSWHIDMDQVYVCEEGKSVLTGFPNGLRNKVADGAAFGRCEYLD